MSFNYLFENPASEELYVRFGEYERFLVSRILRTENGLPCGVEGVIPVASLGQSIVSVIAPYCPTPGVRAKFQLSHPRTVWKFPRERFVTYEPRDESWCRALGIGSEVVLEDRIDADVAIQSLKLSVLTQYRAELTVHFDLCVWTPATILTVAS